MEFELYPNTEILQRHHDYYVRGPYEGYLTEDNRPQLQLAIQRERDLIVMPLGRPIPKPEKIINN